MPPRNDGAGQSVRRAEFAAPGPDSPLTWQQAFPGDNAQLGCLRRWLQDLLPACAARDDVVMVANELGANALLHTASGRDGWFTVEITWSASTVRVAVSDRGAPSGPHMIDDPEAEAGRGLMIVTELAARVEVEGCERGRVVSADVPWTGDSPSAVPRSRSLPACR